MTISVMADQIRIIEYDPSYAGALAEMWNRSNESWGGGTNQRTEDSVRREMENSSNLHVFIAVDGSEVVGLCSFAHYRQDEGALYVPLLNVRPDYHGYKVGRNLILNAVRKTIEAGWPRLDLFTWGGNTKAVPMYKKCGFFWEKNEEYVHLMNFIPTVLQTEALSTYFEELDWYADSTREIIVEPDGRRERGFDYFDYTWRKGELSLRAEFEKTGRGLTALYTPDYEIYTEIEEHDLVFGSAYNIRYHIKNCSAAELKLAIKGQNDKNIRFSMDAALTLASGETTIVDGVFELDPVREEQNAKKTHPVVASQWLINGQRADFRIGVTPKFPLQMKMVLQARELYLGVPTELFLNVENNFASEAEFSFHLPEDEFLEWSNAAVRFTVPAKSKASVPISFILNTYGLYSQDIEVTATRAGENTVSFISKFNVLMKGMYGRFGGELRDQWVAVNGAYSLHMNKLDNGIWIEYPGSSHNFWLAFPKLGKPFSEELSKKRAKAVNIYSEGESEILEALYESGDFPNVDTKLVAKLFASGIVEFHYEISNTGSDVLEENMYVMTNFGFYGKHLILPYQGHYVDMGDAYSGDPGNWDSGLITENWLFCKEDSGTCGIYWDPSLKLQRPEYTLGLEHNLGLIPPGEAVQTKAIVFALNTFTKWSEFRSYATKQRNKVVPLLDNHLDLILGGGNPFTPDVLQVELMERKMSPLAGKLELYLQNRDGEEQKQAEAELLREQDVHTASLKFIPDDLEASKQRESNWKVRAVYHGEDRIQERSGLWLPQTQAAVLCEKEAGVDGTRYTVDNGVLSIAAASDFGSCVYSLKHQGEEWLDTSYPSAAPRSWWNPWYGGLGVGISGLGGFSRQQEPRRIDFVELTDDHGNAWKGLRLTTTIEKQEANRGITVHQHYLMLPGVPVLCVLHSVSNQSGMLLPHYSLYEEGFFKPSPVFSESWLQLPGEGKYTFGKVEAELESKGLLRMGAVTRKNLLHLVNNHPNQRASSYVNNKVLTFGVGHHLSLHNGATAWTQPTFLILGENTLNQEDVHAIQKLTFTSHNDHKENID